jgi:hypothetical protein
LYLEQTARPNDSLRLFFSERANVDFAVRQRNRDSEGTPETEKDTNESTLEWREAYVDWSPGLFTVRVGAQQIVWGEAVGLFVADVVNARDFREMILPDTWLIRRPQWALDVVHNGGLFSQEFVLLVPRANRWPAVDSDFFFLPDEAGPLVRGVDLTTIPEQPLPVSLNTLESGGRLSMLAGGLDLSVFFLHSFEKDPVYFRIPNEANFTGDFEKTMVKAGLFGTLDQIIRVDWDAVATDATGRKVRHKGKGLGRSALNDILHINIKDIKRARQSGCRVP